MHKFNLVTEDDTSIEIGQLHLAKTFTGVRIASENIDTWFSKWYLYFQYLHWNGFSCNELKLKDISPVFILVDCIPMKNHRLFQIVFEYCMNAIEKAYLTAIGPLLWKKT